MSDKSVKKANAAGMLVIMWITLCSLTGYHALQPLFPAISQSFNLPSSTVSLITTCMILPLGIGPIFYGVLLGRIPLVETLATAIVIYSLALLPGPLGANFPVLLCGRIAQGLTLPAIMVCAMTWLSERYEGLRLQKALGLYSFSVIVGSFLGRLIAGSAENILGDWRCALLVNFAVCASALPACCLLAKVTPKSKKFDYRAVGQLLKQKHMPWLLLLPAAMVMASTSVLQVIPFRLKEIDPGITPFTISLVYTGVIFCSTTGFFSAKVMSWLKSEMWAVILSVIIFLTFFMGLGSKSIIIVATCLVLMNFGYAFVYVSMPGIINRFSESEKSVTNGTYLSAYYLYAAIGSYFPLILYEVYGFYFYLWIMFLFAFASLLIAFSLRKLNFR